jgi:hypothetical protein
MRSKREAGWIGVIMLLAVAFGLTPAPWCWIVVGVLVAVGAFLEFTGRILPPLAHLRRLKDRLGRT